MVNITKIQDAFQGLVGFKNPYNPEYAIVDSNNQQSLSGYFVTDNAYAKIEYIKDNQDFANISDSDFNDLLRNIVSSATADVVNQVFTEQNHIDGGLLYANANNQTDTVVLPPHGFVGYKIKFDCKKNTQVRINRVNTSFAGTGQLPLYLFHTSSVLPVMESGITINSSTELNWILSNTEGHAQGDYYIGYLVKDATCHPYKRILNDASVMSEFTGIEIQRVYFANHDTPTMWDLSTVAGMQDDLGLNFDISVYDDFTELAIRNRMLFARAIQLNCIIHCIQMYMASLRDNTNNMQASILYEKMMIDLEGVATNRSIAVKGLKNKLVTEITFIRAEIEKLTMGFSKKGQIFITTMN